MNIILLGESLNRIRVTIRIRDRIGIRIRVKSEPMKVNTRLLLFIKNF